MNSNVVAKAWEWRSFVWAGTVASVVAWAWVWFRQGGASAVMLLFALAAVVFAYRGTQGVRIAVVGLIVAGFVMFLASLYWTYMMLLGANQGVSAMDVVTTGVFPMVAATVLLLGSVAGFRHVKMPTRRPKRRLRLPPEPARGPGTHPSAALRPAAREAVGSPLRQRFDRR